MEKINWKNIFKISSTYISVVLGAGLISGKELLHFFGKYKNAGFFGIFLTGIIFSVLCYKQLLIMKNNKIKNYREFTNKVMGKFFIHICENISILFMLVIMATMISAGGATINEAFGLNYFHGVLLISIGCFISMLFNIEGIVKINSILAPIMVVGGLVVGMYAFCLKVVPTFSVIESFANNNDKTFSSLLFVILSSFIYASYNSITSISLLSNLYNYIDSKKTIIFSSILSGTGIFILATVLLLPLNKHATYISKFQIPLLSILKINPSLINYLYLLILLAAIFTTAISSGISIIKTIEKRFKSNELVSKIILMIIVMLFSRLGFSNFVSLVYPVFGVFGLLQILKIILY